MAGSSGRPHIFEAESPRPGLVGSFLFGRNLTDFRCVVWGILAYSAAQHCRGGRTMASVKAWKQKEKGEPSYPDDFEVAQKAVLQVTDIKTNHNKYYAIELHTGKGKGDYAFRVFTHYGRTDDLETNPDAGQKECRYFATLAEAQGCYQTIYREKTNPRKGYKEVSLASTKIGSHKARGTSAGDVDAKTLEKLAKAKAEAAAKN